MNSPSKYFDGEYLSAARAIDANDIAQLATVAQGLNVDTPGRQQMTLLWYAIQAKNYAAIRLLTSQGSKPDQQGAQGLGTPLFIALTGNDPKTLEAMLDGGLSPNYQDEDGRTLLQQAMIGDNADTIVALLVDRRANVNLQDSIGRTPINAALNVNRPDIAIYLVEHGANVNTHMTNGSTPAWAVQKAIERLQPRALQTPITDISADKGGKLTQTVIVPPAPGSTPTGKELLQQYEQLRALMTQRGVKFPPDSPAQMRAQVNKARGGEE